MPAIFQWFLNGGKIKEKPDMNAGAVVRDAKPDRRVGCLSKDRRSTELPAPK
jgi:hypothetical protein